ncbi:cytochrome b/b6 domain-containing protein [Thalassobaculum sp. OXR-137]|uniref:cytochrome b/b6 domain-containing protein n=1 Tax=Thalassobaculum sp. OXR-137 TaxID=3100173 RepID=UPI002AC9626E|nr:cytochrome b/b6 domain-containing protein [Thalassobaculum sp. OXR-137]WPZ32463.1 cytochrome b/b6 domain-containing protein [Thalassobaculum sp. OXR-137]
MGEYDGKPADAVTVRVWDRPLRLFHWALVLCLAGSWITAEQGMMDWHERFGLTALALVVFRLIWGVVGGEFARFSSFVRGPGAVVTYLRETLAGRHPEYAGHNPLGALAVLALLLLVGVQAGLGLFANDDILYEGPLYHLVGSSLSGTLTGWHHWTFDILLIAVIVHVAAVIVYMVFLRDDLILPMITGVKRMAPQDAPGRIRRTPWWVALAILAVCAAGAYGLTLLA